MYINVSHSLSYFWIFFSIGNMVLLNFKCYFRLFSNLKKKVVFVAHWSFFKVTSGWKGESERYLIKKALEVRSQPPLLLLSWALRAKFHTGRKARNNSLLVGRLFICFTFQAFSSVCKSCYIFNPLLLLILSLVTLFP